MKDHEQRGPGDAMSASPGPASLQPARVRWLSFEQAGLGADSVFELCDLTGRAREDE